MTGRFERLHLDELRNAPTPDPLRPRATDLERRRRIDRHLGQFGAAYTGPIPGDGSGSWSGQADPLRATGTDDDPDLPSGAAAAFVVIAWLMLAAFILGIVVGRLTA